MSTSTTDGLSTYATYPSLVDRTIFITGGADGIGAALVDQFVRQGSKVGFADINAVKGAETVARCAAFDPRHVPRFYEVDLVDIEATQQAIGQAQTDLGGITVLVNNAASDDRHTWGEMTPEYWDNRMNTNLRHYFFAIQAVAPDMLVAQNGSIINIGSSSYMMQEDFFPGYASPSRASKASHARSLAPLAQTTSVSTRCCLVGSPPTDSSQNGGAPKAKLAHCAIRQSNAESCRRSSPKWCCSSPPMTARPARHNNSSSTAGAADVLPGRPRETTAIKPGQSSPDNQARTIKPGQSSPDNQARTIELGQ
jgi:NAD(P)-dependent dehydrogenase (short-subunit alcohol dehydrogenase family)